MPAANPPQVNTGTLATAGERAGVDNGSFPTIQVEKTTF